MNVLQPPLRTLGAAALIALALPAATAQADPGAGLPQRAIVEEIVRDYILNNPEIVMEAIEKLREKRREAELAADRNALRASAAALYEDPAAPVGGNPEGDVTIVEFFDYRCGVCKRVHPIVEELVKSDGKIRRVYKDWPILGPDSVVAARAALASRKQGKYLPFSNAMMESKVNLNRDAVMAIARSVGIDTAKLDADMKAEEIDKIISQNYALADRLGLNGTPSFVIGETIVRGGQGLDAMRALVAEAREKAKAAQ